MQSIVLFVDTNVLEPKVIDYTKLALLSKLESITDELEVNDFYNYVSIRIPQIVVDELLNHQIEGYFSEINKIRNLTFPGFTITVDNQYDGFVRGLYDSFYADKGKYQVAIDIQEYPSSDRFHSVINRAVRKNPPFLGKAKESDKGFKDVLLWESILEFKRNNLRTKVILFSSDKIFCDNFLADEYHRLFFDDLFIISGEEGLKSLMECIAIILHQKVIYSYATELERDLISLLMTADLDWLYDNEYIELNDGQFGFVSMLTRDVEILEQRDGAVKGTIEFNVKLEASITLQKIISHNDDCSIDNQIELTVVYNMVEKEFGIIKCDSCFGTFEFIEPQAI